MRVRPGNRRRRAVEEHQQLVPADPGSQVVGRPQTPANPVGKGFEHGVPGGMPVGVVHHLEPVDVAPQRGQLLTSAFVEKFNPFEHLLPVEEVRQFVRAGATLEDCLGTDLGIDAPERRHNAVDLPLLGPKGAGVDFHPVDVASLGRQLGTHHDRLSLQRRREFTSKLLPALARDEEVVAKVTDAIGLRPAEHGCDRRRYPEDRGVRADANDDVRGVFRQESELPLGGDQLLRHGLAIGDVAPRETDPLIVPHGMDIDAPIAGHPTC